MQNIKHLIKQRSRWIGTQLRSRQLLIAPTVSQNARQILGIMKYLLGFFVIIFKVYTLNAQDFMNQKTIDLNSDGIAERISIEPIQGGQIIIFY